MGLVRRWLELRRLSLATAAAVVVLVALVVDLVVSHGDSKVSLNKIKPPFYPPSSPFIRLVPHRHPLHSILRSVPCQSRANTSHYPTAAQISLILEASRSRSVASDGPPRHAPLPCFSCDTAASLLLAGIVVVFLLLCAAGLCLFPSASAWMRPPELAVVMEVAVCHACASPSRLRRWPPLRSSRVWPPPWWAPFSGRGRFLRVPTVLSSATPSIISWLSTEWTPSQFIASWFVGGRWLLATEWYVSHMHLFSTHFHFPGSCVILVEGKGKGTSYKFFLQCTLLTNKHGSGNTSLSVRADLRLQSTLVLRFNVESSRVNVLSPVKAIRYLRLKNPNPHRHRPVRQPRGAPAVLSEYNKEDPRCFWRGHPSSVAQRPRRRHHLCLLLRKCFFQGCSFPCTLETELFNLSLLSLLDSSVVPQKLHLLLGEKFPKLCTLFSSY